MSLFKPKSYLQRSMGELFQDMDSLGGGINVKIVPQELIGVLPLTPHHPFLHEGFSSQDHLKNSRYLVHTSGKSSRQTKEFKYNHIVRNGSDLQQLLLNQRNFTDWFFQGFNLSMIFFSCSSSTIFETALEIVEKYSDFSSFLSLSCVRFQPRSSDNFATEDISDLFGVHSNVTKIDEAEQIPSEIAVKYLKTLAQIESAEFKSNQLASTIIRFKFKKNHTQSCELNLIRLFEDLFTSPIHSPQPTKYEVGFERGLMNAISECKSTQFISTKDTLYRASIPKTRLLDYLYTAVFSTTKTLVIADLTKVLDSNGTLKMLQAIDGFNQINTVCHKYSSQSFQIVDQTYNPMTRRFKSRQTIEDEIEDNSTKKKKDQASNSLGRTLPITTAFDHNSPKISFKEEMKVLLQRLQSNKQEASSSLVSTNQNDNPKKIQNANLSGNSDNHRNIDEGDQIVPPKSRIKTNPSRNSTYLIEETFKNQIEELNEELQANTCKYEIEICEQREVIKNLQKKLVLIAEESQLGELVRLYESEIYRYIEGQKVLRGQISYLSETKTKQQIKNPANVTGTTTPELRKLKEIIASQNEEIANLEQESNLLKRKIRDSTFAKVDQKLKIERINDLESQRDDFLVKNNGLVTSLSNLAVIVTNLKKDNSQFQKDNHSLKQHVAELEEDNKSQQILVELSIKQRQPRNLIGYQTKQENNNLSSKVVESKDTFRMINPAFDTLRNLTLKSGSGIPEDIVNQFSDQIHEQLSQMSQLIEFYKKQHRSVEDFLLNVVVSLEETFGKNQKNVRDVNKFIRDFLFESIGRQDKQAQILH